LAKNKKFEKQDLLIIAHQEDKLRKWMCTTRVFFFFWS